LKDGSIPQGAQVQKLDLRDNLISSLQELAVLAGLPHLQELLLDGGSPGNSVCGIPGYRTAVAAALPQLLSLDGRPLQSERQPSSGHQAAAAAQHLALAQLQAFQPDQGHPLQLDANGPQQIMQLQPSPVALRNGAGTMHSHGVPIIIHQVALPLDPENFADWLVERLMKTGALQSLWGDHTAAVGPKGEERMASLEARLATLLDERLRPPLAPIHNTASGRGANQGSQEGPKLAANPACKPKDLEQDATTETNATPPSPDALQVLCDEMLVHDPAFIASKEGGYAPLKLPLKVGMLMCRGMLMSCSSSSSN
jgi:hypothetical protein